MYQKPLLRWTIGPVSEIGFEILSHSIELFKSFRNNFDLLVCHNQLDKKRLAKLKEMDVPLFCQDDYKYNLFFKPEGCGWKLYPPRLRLDAHEIIIDNDLILFNDEFLKKFINEDCLLITESNGRRLGNFDSFVPDGVKINSGLIGLPPGFDFEKEIQEMQIISGRQRFEGFFDEQGLVAAVVSKYRYTLINLDEIWVCADQFKLAPVGIHFVRANQGYTDPWNEYRKLKRRPITLL